MYNANLFKDDGVPLETLIEEPLLPNIETSINNIVPHHVFPQSLMQSHMSSLDPLPDWKPVVLDEDCTIIFKSGAIYVGRISRKGMEGKGTYRWRNGTIYEVKFNFNKEKTNFK